MAKGRPRKAGKRQPNGQLRRIVANDQGNDRVQERRTKFELVQGGKAGDHLGSPIGRAWAAGLLDNQPFDPAILRDIGLEYGGLYWMSYGLGKGVAKYGDEPNYGSFESVDNNDPRGKRFDALDKLARSAGHAECMAMHKLCVDYEAFPDDEPAWLTRLINVALAKGKGIIGAGDDDMMKRALKGLCAMVSGK